MARTLERRLFVAINRLFQIVWRYLPMRWHRLFGGRISDLLWWSAHRAVALGGDWRKVDDGIPF